MRPCIGRARLFDSTEPAAHAEAAALCATCPVIDWCREQLALARQQAHSGGGPEGTWAGELIGGTRSIATRHPCGGCGQTFTLQSSSHRYCSEDCRTTARRDKGKRHYRRKVAGLINNPKGEHAQIGA